MPQKVGFVGLGIMGRPMAKNLMHAGYELVLHNRTREKAEELAAEGAAEVADSPREVAEECDVIVTMLPGPPEVERIVAGENGLLAGADEGSLIVDLSTSSPVLAKDLAEKAGRRGIGMLDAPVSGGDVGAIEGTLSIMAGGSEEDFGWALPLFEVMGETVTHVGPAGTGQVVKAANQIVVALAMEAVSEALVLGSKAGVDPTKLLDALSGGLAGNRVMEVKRKNFLERDFEPGGKLEFHRKDLGIALAAAREYGVALPAAAMVDQMFGALEAKGRGGWDHSALLTLIEDLSGGERTPEFVRFRITPASVAQTDDRTMRWVRAALVLCVAAAFGALYLLSAGFRVEVNRALGILGRGDVAGLREYILSFGAWAPVASCLLMVLQALAAPLPSFLITFANGLAFGVFWGWALSVFGHTLAAAVCFGISRALGRIPVEALIGKTGLESADRWFARWGLYAVFLARLVPGVSFDIISYAAGLTRMSFRSFILASVLGIVPQTFVYSFLGHRAPEYVWAFLVFSAIVVGSAVVAFALRRGRQSW